MTKCLSVAALILTKPAGSSLLVQRASFLWALVPALVRIQGVAVCVAGGSSIGAHFSGLCLPLSHFFLPARVICLCFIYGGYHRGSLTLSANTVGSQQPGTSCCIRSLSAFVLVLCHLLTLEKLVSSQSCLPIVARPGGSKVSSGWEGGGIAALPVMKRTLDFDLHVASGDCGSWIAPGQEKGNDYFLSPQSLQSVI